MRNRRGVKRDADSDVLRKEINVVGVNEGEGRWGGNRECVGERGRG